MFKFRRHKVTLFLPLWQIEAKYVFFLSSDFQILFFMSTKFLLSGIANAMGFYCHQQQLGGGKFSIAGGICFDCSFCSWE